MPRPLPARPTPLFRDFIGLNENQSKEPFPPELYRPVASLVRDYHSARFDFGGSSATPPLPKTHDGFDWAARYAGMRAQGWRIDVSLMFETFAPAEWPDLTAAPRAYAERFARVFGPTHGGGLVESVEIGNEPGKYSDDEFRRVFIAMAEGLRAGDPHLRIVTPALITTESHAFAKSVDCLAGLEALYDVLTVHTYAELEQWPTWARSFPEDPRLQKYLPDVRWLCDWRDAHVPDKPIWITEFGYDAHHLPPDPTGPYKWWRGVTDLQQAQWTVRSWLAFATLPVERAYHYFFNDHDRPSLHAAAGLTRNYVPRPVFHASAHLRRSLGDYRFAGLLVNRPGNAMLADFAHEHDTTRRVWVAWSPTGCERTATLQLPSIPGALERAETMPVTSEPVRDLALPSRPRQLTLSESPTYLFWRCE